MCPAAKDRKSISLWERYGRSLSDKSPGTSSNDSFSKALKVPGLHIVDRIELQGKILTIWLSIHFRNDQIISIAFHISFSICDLASLGRYEIFSITLPTKSSKTM